MSSPESRLLWAYEGDSAEARLLRRVLGLDPAATQEQIKQAYRQLALKWYPDRNPTAEATDKFREIAESCAVLSDEAKRNAKSREIFPARSPIATHL